MTNKKPTCFRLCDEAIKCLDALEHDCPGFRSRTDIVEQAIIHEWERRLGLAEYEAAPGLYDLL